MSEILELIKIDYVYVITSVFLILFGFKAIVSLFEWVIVKFGLETKGIRKKREEHELLVTTADSLKELIETHRHDIQKMYDDNLTYRDQSRTIREDLKNSIDNLSQKLDEIQEKTDARFEESERKNNKRIRAELKDRIGQSYRYYHASGKINSMELEALENLIEEYEAAKGENSFVHTVVQKEMYTWEKV